MGSEISTILLQPLLVSICIVQMIIALSYQTRTCSDNTNYGKNIFDLNMGIAAALMIVSILVGFVSAL